MREALKETVIWVEAALNCKDWEWDWDQRVAANEALARARAALHTDEEVK